MNMKQLITAINEAAAAMNQPERIKYNYGGRFHSIDVVNEAAQRQATLFIDTSTRALTRQLQDYYDRFYKEQQHG